MLPAKALCFGAQVSYGAGSRICRRVISPTGAYVIDRIHDFATHADPDGGHRREATRSLKSLKHDLYDILRPFGFDNTIPREGRDHARNTLAVELMAGYSG